MLSYFFTDMAKSWREFGWRGREQFLKGVIMCGSGVAEEPEATL